MDERMTPKEIEEAITSMEDRLSRLKEYL